MESYNKVMMIFWIIKNLREKKFFSKFGVEGYILLNSIHYVTLFTDPLFILETKPEIYRYIHYEVFSEIT